MVTNFFILNFLKAIVVGGILDLLINSHTFFAHRRVLVCFLDTILRLKAKTVPTVQQ